MVNRSTHTGRYMLRLRYAVTYLLVLLIPFAAFSVFFNSYLKTEGEKNAQAQMESELQHISENFDRKVAEMFAVSTCVGNLEYFKAKQLTDFDAASMVAIRKQLLAFRSSNSFFSDIQYYNRALPGQVFTSLGTYSVNCYRVFEDASIGGYLPLNELTENCYRGGWWSAADCANTKIVLPEAVFYFQPVELIPGSLLLFEIRESNIYPAMVGALDDDSELYILSGKKVLYPFHCSDVPNVPADTVVHEKGRYAYRMEGAENGLTFILVAEINSFVPVMQRALNGFILMLSAAGVACIVAVLIMSRSHAKPIEQLVEMAKDITSQNVRGVDGVRSAMRQLQSRSQELDKCVRALCASMR